MNKCGIVKDLFTAYVSGVGSEETTSLVEEHIRTCEECRNKLAEVQNRVAITLREKDASSVNVFKTMKKKIFRRNVMVAVIASAISISLAIGGFWFVFHNDTPIEYEKGIIRCERGIAETHLEAEGITFNSYVLDVVCDKDYYGSYGTSRVITRDGEKIHVIYIYLTETLSTKWSTKKDDGRLIRYVGVNEDGLFGSEIIGQPTIPMEVYYIVKPLQEFNGLNDDQFYAERSYGTLLWSGKLE